MATTDGGPSPNWTQVQQLARNVSTDLAIRVPAAVTTLQDVKKNGETLMSSAQSRLQKQLQRLDAEEWTLLGKINSTEAQKRKRMMHKSASDAMLVRSRRVTPAARSTQKIMAIESPTKRSEGFEWLHAFNERINIARESSRPKFELLSRNGFEEHAKQLVHSASNVRLDQLASKIIEKPKEAIATAQKTFNNCQQNLQALQLSLQRTINDNTAGWKQQIQELGEPGNLSSSGNRLAEILSRAPTITNDFRLQLQDLRGEGESPGGDQNLPTYFQGLIRKGSFETLPIQDDDSTCDEKEAASGESSPSSKPRGPFQQQAEIRRRQRKNQQNSTLREQGRQITIVTTASLPWMTGTAVNPLLRAAYLAKDGARSVTLMIPWLSVSDQRRVYPNQMTFETPEDQEAYVRSWVRNRTGFESDFNVTFYPGRYAPEKCSILPVGDPTKFIPDSAADVAILEEPEHLTWYHHGKRWTDKFAHVVGVVHTNYLDYARREEGGEIKESLLRGINAWVTRIHCHKVVKLSDAVQDLPRQTTQFVHGVAETFLNVGEKKAQAAERGGQRFSQGAYFIGKCVWAKGYTELLDLLSKTPQKIPVDCFGTGEDLNDVRAEASRLQLGLNFHGARDHLDDSIHDYKVFINPSTSDVVATTTAEALAMGKWVICADHPSNKFFSQFRNCLIYKTPEEFSNRVQHALQHDPAPMTREEREKLTWDAATERFLDVTELSQQDLDPGALVRLGDTIAWATHNSLIGLEPLRIAAGAGSNTRDTPMNLLDYEPSNEDYGGFFDDPRRALTAYKKG